MSNTTRPNILNHLAHCNGFDQTYKNRSYPNVVYSPMIRWLMTEADLYWLVSDMLVIAGCRSRQFRAIQEDWHTTVKFINGRTEYWGVDPMTGRDKLIHTQYYDSHDCPHDLTFYLRDHEDGGRAVKLVCVAQED